MSIHAKLDGALIDNIKSGKRKLIAVSGGAVGNEAASLSILTDMTSHSIIDSRLQAMRKAGRIIYRLGVGWSIPEEAKQ